MSRLSDRLTRPRWAVQAGAHRPPPRRWVVPLRLTAAALARMALTIALSLTLWAAGPALLGWHPTTVVSGSMEPRINPGDVVSARPVPPETLQPGMVVLVDDPDHPDRLRLHRLVRLAPEGQLVLKGDANPREDSSHVDSQDVRGVGALRIPYVALPLLWLRENAWGKLAVLVTVILALVAALGLGRDLTPAVEADTHASGNGVDAAGLPHPEMGGQGTSGEPTA